ncbi:hypothetical protein [Mycoplasma parvum]|uniref:Uncharacterized protein n=1 Tax=Mycoplasma parvum str. Indiana TaxID=1403316 RepID=U5NC91_9MOLU|nr:hypothetical protein [Mycoplasma parvum]AGX88920.1 hypothetical protein PRV_00775 [Mycoplasma parvum str. Indiana]
MTVTKASTAFSLRDKELEGGKSSSVEFGLRIYLLSGWGKVTWLDFDADENGGWDNIAAMIVEIKPNEANARGKVKLTK